MVSRLANSDCWTIAALVCLMLAGCTTLPKRGQVSNIDPTSLDDATFIHYLASIPTVTVSEAARGVLLLRGATEEWPSYAEQRHELVRLGALKTDWGLNPEDTLDMGTLGYMLRVTCNLSPSLSEKVASVTGLGLRRYALRRCIDAGLLPYASSAQPVRGGELAAALAKAEEFVEPPTPNPPVEVAGETS